LLTTWRLLGDDQRNQGSTPRRRELKEVVAEKTLQVRLLKKVRSRVWGEPRNEMSHLSEQLEIGHLHEQSRLHHEDARGRHFQTFYGSCDLYRIGLGH
jgi:hypothetical protein